MKDTTIVFARAPRLGAVKRRLAREIGDRSALRFYVDTLRRLLADLRRDRRFRTVLAITPDRAPLPVWLRRSGAPVVGQGRGDLGARMTRSFARFPRGRVAILGSDIPQAGASDLRAAFRALGTADAVFGPALDGGYWLVALGPRRPARPFAGIRWSTRHALADTTARFRGRRIALVRCLRDVDEVADLDALGLLGRVLPVLVQPRHQLDEVAGPMADVELPDQYVVPGVLHRAGAAGQGE